MSHYQKTGQRHTIKIANRCFKDVAKFKYLAITLTDQNCMHEEINSRLIRGMLAITHFSLLSSHLLSKNVKTTVQKKHNCASCFAWV
jgi:hypothetical protein